MAATSSAALATGLKGMALSVIQGFQIAAISALSSGKAGVAGATIPITSLCSGGETLDGEQSRF